MKIIVKDTNEDDEMLFLSIERSNFYNNSDMYQPVNKIQRAKYIIIDMVKDINFFNNYRKNKGPQQNFGDQITFKRFSEYIFHLRKIFRVIVESYNCYDEAKKEKFVELLVSLIDKLYCLEIIDELTSSFIKTRPDDIEDRKSNDSSLTNFKTEAINKLSLEDKHSTLNVDTKNISERLRDLDIQIKKLTEKNSNPIELEFIKVCGNSFNFNMSTLNRTNFVDSIEVSKYPITNYQYLKFVEKGGYFKEKYWSKDGYYWKNFCNLTKPNHWEHKNNIWYVNGSLLSNYYDYPILKISYYEAEACCKFYSCRLPYEYEWNYISSNRNNTLNPYGLYNLGNPDGL